MYYFLLTKKCCPIKCRTAKTILNFKSRNIKNSRKIRLPYTARITQSTDSSPQLSDSTTNIISFCQKGTRLNPLRHRYLSLLQHRCVRFTQKLLIIKCTSIDSSRITYYEIICQYQYRKKSDNKKRKTKKNLDKLTTV